MDNAATTPHGGKSGDHQHHYSAHTKARRKLAKYENTDQGRLRLAFLTMSINTFCSRTIGFCSQATSSGSYPSTATQP